MNNMILKVVDSESVVGEINAICINKADSY